MYNVASTTSAYEQNDISCLLFSGVVSLVDAGDGEAMGIPENGDIAKEEDGSNLLIVRTANAVTIWASAPFPKIQARDFRCLQGCHI